MRKQAKWCLAGVIGIAALGVFYLRKGTLHERRWLLWILVFSVLGPQLANQMSCSPSRREMGLLPAGRAGDAFAGSRLQSSSFSGVRMIGDAADKTTSWKASAIVAS